jgi:hypothetical protein
LPALKPPSDCVSPAGDMASVRQSARLLPKLRPARHPARFCYQCQAPTECLAGSRSGRALASLARGCHGKVLTGEDLGAEQELELVQELLGSSIAGDGRLVCLLDDDGQVGDRVEVVLIPAGPRIAGASECCCRRTGLLSRLELRRMPL